MVEDLKRILKIDNNIDLRTYSPLVLAYLGDSVYELAVRTYITSSANMPVNKLNSIGSRYSKAVTQSKIVREMLPLLTDKEREIYKRGRNAKSRTTAKNASVIEYRMATGFECLIGYLYLEGSYERMAELIKLGFHIVKKNTAGSFFRKEE